MFCMAVKKEYKIIIIKMAIIVGRERVKVTEICREKEKERDC